MKEIKDLKPKSYDKLIDKLIDLCGYAKVFNDQDLCYDEDKEFVASYSKTRSEVTNLIAKEYREIITLFQLLLSSRMVRICHGDLHKEELVEFEARSINLSWENDIKLELGDIVSTSMKMPSNFLESYSHHYDIIPLEPDKDMIDKSKVGQQDKAN